MNALKNERKNINEAIQEIQEAREPTIEKDRVQPGLKENCLETCVLQNYNHVYQCPIFEHTEENSAPTEDTAGELFFSLNKNCCELMSANNDLNSQEGRRDVKVVESNSLLELLKIQLCTNHQVRNLVTCHLLTNLIHIDNFFLYNVFILIAQFAQLRNPMISLCQLPF